MKVPGLSDWLTEVSDNLSAIINSSIKTAVSGGLGLAGSTMTAVWLAFLFVVLAGLGVVYAPTLHKLTLRVTQLPEASLNRFILTLRNALRAVFIGLIFVPIIQGTLTGVGLRLVGVSEPAFWGLLAAFAAVIPVVGTAPRLGSSGPGAVDTGLAGRGPGFGRLGLHRSGRFGQPGSALPVENRH